MIIFGEKSGTMNFSKAPSDLKSAKMIFLPITFSKLPISDRK